MVPPEIRQKKYIKKKLIFSLKHLTVANKTDNISHHKGILSFLKVVIQILASQTHSLTLSVS